MYKAYELRSSDRFVSRSFMICGLLWIVIAVGREVFRLDNDTIVELLARILSKFSLLCGLDAVTDLLVLSCR